MKAIHKIYGVLALLIFVLVGLIIGSLMSGKSTNHELQATEDVAQSHYPGIQIATEVEEKAHYHSAVHYPVFKDDKLNKTITAFVEEEKAHYLKEVADNEVLLTERGWQASFYLTFDIHPVEDELYSIVFSTESYVMGANGRQTSKVFMVDLGSENFVTADDIIRVNEETRDVLYTTLKNYFDTSTDYQDMFFDDLLQEWIESTDFSNLYLSRDAITFKFDKYEVTAGAAGSPEVAIPLNDAGPFLKEEWLKKLKVDEPTEKNLETDNVSAGEKEEDDQLISIDKKKVALTFDDGPHSENTLKALQLLAEYDMKATFFMLGSRIDFYPDLVKEVFNQGHEIGNHTWNHKQLTKISDAAIKEEINSVNQKLKDIIGESATVFRPPYGATNDHVESFLTVPSVLWTIDTLDWKTKNPDAILAEVKENLKPGAIILMHDIHATTIDALELVLPYLEEQGYTSVEVSKVLE
ncbi:Peptidoglycan/xylan/chitin deacetylase, PgdA/CDA1 family [Halolactibacillus halophilus]|uniref:Peptidoglycan-N-acetylmuramic acid deacetylase PdaC n=1 Tax=Halolactibacillus halophilus TaxID=306540 RepID=A0A1I5PYJ1_9BACI|nr:polysaccharide deacetylase family protein [Halolactibacillus halophilus]GEM02261.1 peptidoglycan-N-acetylmuramic acid deacetylase PdaC [Halolactibacillus halophilus]SFP39007.1 Peptidoglycan/xylan/chitin deacetylase, PgdA/CDA1 family [Halolactibacillus halophilus]